MKKYLTEFIGTFFLVLIIGLSQNPLAIGFGLTVLVYMGDDDVSHCIPAKGEFHAEQRDAENVWRQIRKRDRGEHK